MLPPVFDRPQETVIEFEVEKKPDIYDMDRGMDIACREMTDALHLKLDDADKMSFKRAMSNFIEMFMKKQEMEKHNEGTHEEY